MSKLFLFFNEVESHNKPRHYNLALEKFWVTQCGCIWLYTEVVMGMTIKIFRKIFCYGVNRYHYNKYIGIIEISEKLALDLFNNTFTTDTGNM